MDRMEKIRVYAQKSKFNDDAISTRTSLEQIEVEKLIENCYEDYFNTHNEQILFRSKHINFLEEGLYKPMESSMIFLDSSRAWMTYWVSLSLNLLGESEFLRENSDQIIDFLKRCESALGGYGGGPSQDPHLASTYAAINALVTIGNEAAFRSINIDGIRKFLERMQQPDGSFTLHDSGEIDIRGVYCALAIAKLLRIPIYTDEDQGSNLFADSVAWILSCQNYEGGFGAAPGHEAHGGYTFCGVAVLAILDKLHLCNIDALLRWVSNRQMKYEGGFSGRTNKLVDGCYSFWNGAVIPIIQTWLARNGQIKFDRWIFNQEALQEYILVCCQNKSCGGLTDKPGRQPDFYHCCYVISGFAVAQHNFDDPTVIGVKENLLNPTHLLYNVPFDSLHSFEKFFLKSPKS